MSGQLEQSQYSNDAEELEYVRVLDVRHVLLEEEVGVEADGGDVVDHVHGGLEEMVFVGAGYKSKKKKLTGYETVCSVGAQDSSSSRVLLNISNAN